MAAPCGALVSVGITLFVGTPPVIVLEQAHALHWFMTRVISTGLVLSIAVLSLTARAQQPLEAIAFIDSQYLFSLHPLYAQVQELTEAARLEIAEVVGTIEGLQSKQQTGDLSQQETELLQVSLATVQALEARYDAEIKALAEPMRTAVDAAISQVASRLSIGMVIDAQNARQLGLIVYAASENDITTLVEEQLLSDLN